MASKRFPQLAATGSGAPGFRLRTPGGEEVALGGLLAEGPVVLAFFKVSCPVCQLTLPFLDRIHPAMRVYGISQDDARWTGDFVKRYSLTFPMLLDPEEDDYPASNAYGISSVPTLFLVEPEGNISRVIEGFRRREIQEIADRAGVSPFRPSEYVPEWKAG